MPEPLPNHPSFYPDPYEGWTLDPNYYQATIARLGLKGDELRTALHNSVNVTLRHYIRLAAEKNIWLVMPRPFLREFTNVPLSHEMGDFFRVAMQAIEEIPSEILWKGSFGVPLILGKINHPHTKGQANIQDIQKGVRIGQSQFFIDGEPLTSAKAPRRTVDAKKLKEVIVHELLHNLSVQQDRNGKFLMPVQDWKDLAAANGVQQIITTTPQIIEAIMKQWSCVMHPTRIEDLGRNTDQFLERLKTRLALPQLYASDPFEMVSYSATNVDMSDDDHFAFPNPHHNLEASRAILRRNFLRHPIPIDPELKIYYGYEYDGEKWQLYHIQNIGTEQNPIWTEDVNWE